MKGRIPKWTRIMFIKNKNKKSEKHPDFIGYFVEAKVAGAGAEIKKPYIALRNQIYEEAGTPIEENDRDIAAEVFGFIRDHPDDVLDAIRAGVDSTGLYGKICDYFGV